MVAKRRIIILLLLLPISVCFANKEYDRLCDSIQKKQSQFRNYYKKASISQKEKIIEEATEYLCITLTEQIFPSWYGTPWEFYGTSRTPQEGSIACGYFVTHTLHDAGFNLPRTTWAQKASEYMIKRLCPINIKRFSNKPLEQVKAYLLSQGNGIYLVGLDCHVGFITVNDSEIRFVHSSYYHPHIGVMSEFIDSVNPLSDSQYRVIGTLLSRQTVKAWITGKRFQ